MKPKVRKKSKKMVGIRCQCQDRAVPISKDEMCVVQCPVCLKIYKTNHTENICFSCKTKARY